MSDDRNTDFFEGSLGDPDAQVQAQGNDESMTVGTDAVKGMFDKKTGLLNPTNRKRLIFMGGTALALIVSIGYTFMAGEPQVAKGQVGEVSSRAFSSDGDGSADERVQESVRRYNSEKLAEVQEKDPFAHPIVLHEDEEEYIDPFADDEPEPEAQGEEVAEVAPSTVPQATQRYLGEEQEQVAMDLLARLSEQEGSIPQNMSVGWTYAAPRSSGGGQGRTDAKDETEEEVESNVCTTRSVRAGEVLYATTDLAMNSDVGGEVSVTVRSGALRNHKMLGKFERREKWLRIELSRLVAANGVVPIQAVALDMDTTLNAVSGKVDRHLVYRYGWWGFGAVLKAMGKAAELGANKEVYHVDGSVVEDMKSTTSQELKMALGELGADMGDVFRERLNRPITVSLKRGEQVGIFVLDDICVD